MVFPSVPLYLDPPTTWSQQQQLALHQQPQQQQPLGGGGGGSGGSGSGGGDDHQQLVQRQPHQQNQLPLRGDAGPGSTLSGFPRPNSTADRARLAKIPQPEQALKCPRCDSTNTKFCYFNNYSLSQPRHFCKTCRRYWTRGGALRNVPVGGGCRRNKRSSNKSSSNKSASATEKAAGASSSSTATSSGTASLPAPSQHLPFGMQSLHSNPMMEYGSMVPNIGLGFSSMQGMDSVDGSNYMGLEQWRLNQIQQFPFLGGMESQLPPSAAMYSSFDGQAGTGVPMTGSELITQLASVKMEDHNNRRGMNLARQYLGSGSGVSPRNDQFWGGSAAAGGGGNGGVEGSGGAAGGSGGGGGGGGWMTNLSGFNSSSTGSLL